MLRLKHVARCRFIREVPGVCVCLCMQKKRKNEDGNEIKIEMRSRTKKKKAVDTTRKKGEAIATTILAEYLPLRNIYNPESSHTGMKSALVRVHLGLEENR